MFLIDTHAHMDMEEYHHNLEEVLSNAKKAGVEKIIVPGVTQKDTPRIIELIEKHEMLYGAVAIHPSEAKDWNDTTYGYLKQCAQHPKVVAIGETGLDYYWDKTFNEQQKFVFKEHIKLAIEVQKPLVVHDREAHKDCFDILKEMEVSKHIDVIFHCFSGSPEFAQECAKAGYYIALGGVVTFKNAHKPKEVARIIPIDKLLLETDSPYLAPHPFRGKTNSPEYVKLVAQEIAALRNMSFEEIADATTQNAKKVFGI